ncbi:MAG: hypothetical protein H6923_07985 [Alphaproteobacteria bacterium]|nr:hypothetical protein [Alphaproteobacteria bacterium]
MESFANLVLAPFDQTPAWLNLAFAVVTAASAVTALTPTPADDRWVGRLYRVIEMLALNIGRAKDKAPQSDA